MARRKGSITLFSVIALLLVTAAIFAILEGTRLQELRRFADLQTEAALEAAFAEYNTCLWQEYHLLGTEQSQMKVILEETANGRQGSGANFLRFVPTKIEVVNNSRITDGEGAVFIHAVSTYMKDNMLYEAIKEIYSQYEAIKQVLDSSELDVSNITEAIEEMKHLGETKEKNSFGTAKKNKVEKGIDVQALLKTAERWKKMGILELVIEDTSKLSEQEVDFENGLLKRKLQKGTTEKFVATNWEDRILLQQYLLTYMSSLQSPKEGRALSYELEYLLGEKSSDVANLKSVATKILAIREASNFLYLLSNPAKVAEAEALAIAIGGISLNPALIELIKIALLTAWALAESILDVRALLGGKRVALLKSDESWTLGLENIGGITEGFMTAKESIWGLSYENYLGILLLLEKEKKLAMHAMNVQEATIRKAYEDESFCLDSLVTEASTEISYTYEPVFPFLRVIDAQMRWEYKLLGAEDYSYY